jgi:hypothetical protein
VHFAGFGMISTRNGESSSCMEWGLKELLAAQAVTQICQSVSVSRPLLPWRRVL